MIIGIPKALFYYRYGVLWKTFFKKLGNEVLISDDTYPEIMETGVKNSIDENCLPLKIFMGQVKSLAGKCDYIFVPRFARTGLNDEYCVRFWGLPDLVRNTFRDVCVLSCDIDSCNKNIEKIEFIKIGIKLKNDPVRALIAYREGKKAQIEFDMIKEQEQNKKLILDGKKILIATQPYLIYDKYIGGTIQRIIKKQGGIALFSDCCDRKKCNNLSKDIMDDLYWIMNREIVGAISMNLEFIDGVILLTAFPCGTDSLVNEMIIRKIKNIPLIQITLDEHQANAGLETRIESFMDIL